MKRSRAWSIVAIGLLCVMLLTACASAAPRFVDDGRSLSADEALALPADVNAGAVAGRPASEAGKLRFNALSAMRKEGGRPAAAAAVITRSLPADSRSVPFYVEYARVDSVPAIIVIEAMGPRGGTLEDKRVWVLDHSGKVLLAGSR